MKLVDNAWYCSSIDTLYIPPVGGVPMVGVVVLGDSVVVPVDSIDGDTLFYW